MNAALSILHGGLHTTVQDRGRYGLQAIGVPVSGALDAVALHVANVLVGNAPGCAALEILGTGPVLEVNAESVRLAIAGANASLEVLAPNRRALSCFESFRLQRGEIFRVGALSDGAVTYLAVEGGLDLPMLLGSRSTYTRAAFGGFQGRAITTDDDLPLVLQGVLERKESRLRGRALPGQLPIRIIPGPQDDFFTSDALETLLTNEYTVSPAVDRMGMRLDGPRLEHARGFNITSDGTAPGSIQVPGDGLPIVLLADRQTTGGYPKIGCVISADFATIARLRQGDTVSFVLASLDEAARARIEQDRWLSALSSRIESIAPSGIIDTTALTTENLISGVVGLDEPSGQGN